MFVLSGYAHIKFTCFTQNFLTVHAAARKHLCRNDRTALVHERSATVNLSQIYTVEPVPGGRHRAEALFFAPQIAPSVTVMFTNLADGWNSLAHCLSKRLPGPVYPFSLSSDRAEWPRYAFNKLVNSDTIRHVSAMKDVNRWIFYETGDPLPEEDVSYYKKRRVKDRLPREYLIELATRLGFPVGDDRFWQSDSEGVYFKEERKPWHT